MERSESQDGLPFFSMKFASGGSSLEKVAYCAASRDGAVALMAKVACAVQYAHEQGKPPIAILKPGTFYWTAAAY